MTLHQWKTTVDGGVVTCKACGVRRLPLAAAQADCPGQQLRFYTESLELVGRTKNRDGDRITVTTSGYGYMVEPDHHEWALVIQLTSRQDGRTAFGVMLAEVDGDVTHCGGTVKTGAVGQAISDAVRGLTSRSSACWPIEIKVVKGVR